MSSPASPEQDELDDDTKPVLSGLDNTRPTGPKKRARKTSPKATRPPTRKKATAITAGVATSATGASAKAHLGQRIVLAGMAHVMGNAKEESQETGLTEQQIRNQLNLGRSNLRKTLLDFVAAL